MRIQPPTFALLALVLTASARLPLLAQTTGTIKGIVVDSRDTPIANALVNAHPLGGHLMATGVRYVATDSEGKFVINDLQWGSYGIFAKKEESGYPNMAFSFYSNDRFPKATVSLSSPSADVRVRLGPVAGTLYGSIVNSETGAPINARITLARANAQEKSLAISAAPDFKILVPASTPVDLEVSAPGFKSWRPSYTLLLQPGQTLQMNIALVPAHDPSLQPSRFLVPQDYVGWLLLDYNVKGAPATPSDGNFMVFRFPATGALSTSSPGPERGAEEEYFFYSPDGTLRKIPTDYRNGRAMLWGKHEGTRDGQLTQFGFFVGTEKQYKRFQTRAAHPGPVQRPQNATDP